VWEADRNPARIIGKDQEAVVQGSQVFLKAMAQPLELVVINIQGLDSQVSEVEESQLHPTLSECLQIANPLPPPS
jgi:hypothetical protein